MKNYIMYSKPKYRFNRIIKDNSNKIIVKHDEKIEINNIDLKSLFKETTLKNEMISEISGIFNGYCNEYLKNKIKTIRAEYIKDKKIPKFKIYNDEIKNNINYYTTIYTEDELVNIILKFGKALYTISKVDLNAIYLENQDLEYIYKMSFNSIIKSLKLNERKLEKIINKTIYKIGVPTNIDKDNTSNWNYVIYVSLLSYLYVESVLGRIRLNFNIIPLLRYILLKFNKNVSEIEIIIKKIGKGSKEVKKIKSIIPFIIYYIENHYYYINDYDNWYADHLIDELEDFRQSLLLNTKSIQKKKKYNDYSYKQLNELLHRKKFKY